MVFLQRKSLPFLAPPQRHAGRLLLPAGAFYIGRHPQPAALKREM
jgi:hypothetical protein